MALLRQILNFQKAHAMLATASSSGSRQCWKTPESIPLHLPLSLCVDDQRVICDKGVASIGECLRVGQANEALLMVRRQLQIHAVACQYKSRSVASQHSYIWSRDLEQAIEFQILLARHQYCAAHKALLSLCGPGEWEQVLQELWLEDIRGINERVLTAEEDQIYQQTREMAGVSVDMSNEDLRSGNILTVSLKPSQVGDGPRTLSWIWYTVSKSELCGSAVHASKFLQSHG